MELGFPGSPRSDDRSPRRPAEGGPGECFRASRGGLKVPGAVASKGGTRPRPRGVRRRDQAMQTQVSERLEPASRLLDPELWRRGAEWISDPTNAAIVGGCALVWIVAWWAIFARAGFTGALSLLMLLPGINVIVFVLFAFGGWPVMRELRSLRRLETAVARAEDRYSTSRAA